MRARLRRAGLAVIAFALLATGAPSPGGAALPAWSSARDTIFRVLAADAALPEGSVPLSIAQDGAGLIWIATEMGVSRWDGRSFRTFSGDGQPGSLPDSSAKVVFADARGRLWVGLGSEGLLRFDPADETFRRPANATRLDGERIFAIANGRAGAIWVASVSGVARVDGRSFAADADAGRRLGLPPGPASSVVEDAQGRLKVLSGGRLYAQAVAGGRLRPVDLAIAGDAGSVGARGTTLFVDHAGQLWVSTVSSGIVLVDRSGKAFRRVMLKAGGQRAPQPMVMTAIEVMPGVVWLDTHEGIFEVDTRTWTTRRYHHERDRPSSLADDSVNALMMDRSGLVWIGAAFTLSIADPRAAAVANLQTALGYGAGGTFYHAYSIARSPDGRLWLGAQDDPVRILDPGDGVPRRIGDDRARPRGVTSFAFLDGGRVYAAAESGLFRMSLDGRVLKRVSAQPARQLLQAGGVLYVGGSGGLSRVDFTPAGERLVKVVDAAKLTFPQVTTLLAAADGALWIGTSHGLNRFEPATGRLTRFDPNAHDPKALGANYVNSLLFDAAGRLWVATGDGGIDILARDRSGFRHVRRRNGLPNDTVDALLPASDGSIWASTDGGIVRIDPDTFATTTLREAEGLQSLTFWQGGGLALPGGALAFVGTGGLSFVDPLAARAPRGGHGRLVVTELQVGKRKVPFDPAAGSRRIALPAGVGSFGVEFSALDFAAADRISYSYRLAGFESGWNQADVSHRIARYTNLPPGDYVLQLRATGRDGGPEGDRLNIPVYVAAAWYQTAAARLGAVVLLLVAGWGAMHLRVRFLRRRERLLEAVVEERTAALERSKVELKKLAYFDALTGLANRRMFTQNLQRLLTPTKRHAPAFALILVDLDRFKSINDGLGHDAGDALLVEVAGRLVSSVREGDSVARLGGDEFAILVAGHIDARSIELLCGRVVSAVASPILFAGNMLDTSASLGVALFPDNGQTQDELYKAADLALYAAKRAGRNTWRLYSAQADPLPR